MATANIPLNFFKRYSFTLTNTPSAVYTAPFSRAAILLNGYMANATALDATITMSVSGAGDSLTAVLPRPEFYIPKMCLWLVVIQQMYSLQNLYWKQQTA